MLDTPRQTAVPCDICTNKVLSVYESIEYDIQWCNQCGSIYFYNNITEEPLMMMPQLTEKLD